MDIELKTTIAARLQKILECSGKRQKDLAAYLGVPDNTISYFVSGKRTPNIEQIVKIAEYFSVSTDYLLGLSDVETTDINIKAICDYTGLSEEAISTLHFVKRWKNFVFLNDFICEFNSFDVIDEYIESLDDEWISLENTLKIYYHERRVSDDEFEEDGIIEEYEDSIDSLQMLLLDCLKIIDSVDLKYYRAVEAIKNSLVNFVSDKQLAFDKKRPEIRKIILELEGKKSGNHNEA